MSDWIKCSDELPPIASTSKYGYSTTIRVLCACKQKNGKRMVKEGYAFICDYYTAWKIPGTIDCVTHWMYLPDLPQEEEERKEI